MEHPFGGPAVNGPAGRARARRPPRAAAASPVKGGRITGCGPPRHRDRRRVAPKGALHVLFHHVHQLARLGDALHAREGQRTHAEQLFASMGAASWGARVRSRLRRITMAGRRVRSRAAAHVDFAAARSTCMWSRAAAGPTPARLPAPNPRPREKHHALHDDGPGRPGYGSGHHAHRAGAGRDGPIRRGAGQGGRAARG